MATIVTRSGKGSPLTNTEVDANFTNLNSDKLETNAEVRAAVEAATDSNVFTDADHTKLNSVEASADVTDTANVVAALTAGSNITIGNDGTIAGAAAYSLPAASANTLGGVKIGSGLSIDGSGVVSASGATNLASTTASTTIVITSSTGNNATIAAATTSAAGVMIAADKSKLDGIEASATADQTAAQMLTAIKTVDGASSGLDADLLDGVELSGIVQRTFADSSRNLEIRTNSTGSAGLEMQASDGSYRVQLYGTGSQYGFLDGSWTDWDIQKTVNGAFQVDEGAGLVRVLTAAGGTVTGDVQFNTGANIHRGTHSSGYLVGGYNNIGASASNTNPIFTIGTSYQPTDTALGSMYGIGYTRGDASFTTSLAGGSGSGWGMYVAAGGNAKIWLGGETGNIRLTGTVDGRDVAADGTKLDTIATSANNYSFPYTVSDSAGNSTVVQRNSSGYVFANYFNSTDDDVTTGSVGGIICKTSNDYHRTASAAAVRSFINVENGANNFSMPSALVPASIDFNGAGPTLSEERDQNMKIRGHSGTDVGISGYDSSNNWRFQLYGSASNYGFLDGNWASWDIQKTVNGNLYLNGNTTYYLNPPSTTVLNTLNVAGVADFDGGHGAINITNSSILSSASSNWTGNPGASGKIQYHSNRWYLVGDSSANTNMITFRKDTTDQAFVTNVGAFNGSAVSVSGNVTAYSDERLKENIEVIPNALDKVLTLKGVTFDRTDVDIQRQTGVIAQDVIKVLPEAVSIDTNANGMYSVAYGNMVGLLIEAIKELKAEVEELKNGSTN